MTMITTLITTGCLCIVPVALALAIVIEHSPGIVTRVLEKRQTRARIPQAIWRRR